YCQQILAERKRQIEEAGGLPDASLALQKEAQELVGNYELLEAGIELDDAENMSRLIKASGLTLKPDTEAYHLLRKNYHLALPAFSHELLRLHDEQKVFDFKPSPALAVEPGKVHKVFALEDAAGGFIKFASDEKKWDQNTLNERSAHLAVLKEILGDQFDVAMIDAERARYVRDTIKRIPKNRNKNPRTRGLSLAKAIEVKEVEAIAA